MERESGGDSMYVSSSGNNSGSPLLSFHQCSFPGSWVPKQVASPTELSPWSYYRKQTLAPSGSEDRSFLLYGKILSCPWLSGYCRKALKPGKGRLPCCEPPFQQFVQDAFLLSPAPPTVLILEISKGESTSSADVTSA